MSQHKARAKFDKVLGEFKGGTLKSSSGGKVTSRDQALAIAFSEAREVEPGFGSKTILTGKRNRKRKQ